MDFVTSLSFLNSAEELTNAALQNGNSARGLGFLGSAMSFLSDFYAQPVPVQLAARAEQLKAKIQELMPGFSINSASKTDSFRGDSVMRYDNFRSEQIAANVCYKIDAMGNRNPALKPNIILAINELSSIAADFSTVPQEKTAASRLIATLQTLLQSLPESNGAPLVGNGDSYGGGSAQTDPTCYGLALGFNGDPQVFGISHQTEPGFEAMQAAYMSAQRGAA